MQLTSTAFRQGGTIPKRFTCEGENLSPQVSWSGTPKETKSLVLVVHDPDAPRANGFVHWVVYKIPPTTSALEENTPTKASIPGLGVQGKNDSGKIGYMGPCPHSGNHRYFFRLYALRQEVDLQPGATYQQVMGAIEGKIIEQAELMGTYAKGGQKVA